MHMKKCRYRKRTDRCENCISGKLTGRLNTFCPNASGTVKNADGPDFFHQLIFAEAFSIDKNRIYDKLVSEIL